jgi:uncharacterized membrane protein YphA (DoxX/SURF4 family)
LELIGCILLIVGVLSRIASSFIAIDMLGVMVYVKKLKSFSGNGVENLLMFITLLAIIFLWYVRISLSYIAKDSKISAIVLQTGFV